MGGEGSMASAIQTLKQNRALLKKRKFKDIRKLVYESSGKTELEFKTISNKELFNIKQAIRKKQKRNAKIQIGIYIIAFTLATGFVYFIHRWLYSFLE